MRVIVPHNKPKQEVKLAVEQSVDQLFVGLAVVPIEFTDHKKHWSGDTLIFSFTAKMGFLKTPIHGSALVTDRDITLELDLGLLNKLIPEDLARNKIGAQVKGLLT
jgi:hypothetical protein